MFRRPLLLVGVLMSGLFFDSVHAQPPALFGVSHIKNESTATATLYYKWGKGSQNWKKYVLERGKAVYIHWKYDGPSNVSPDLVVRMDVDTDGVRFVEHILSRGASPDENSPNYGHHFVVKQIAGTDTRYIDAVKPNGAKVSITGRTQPDLAQVELVQAVFRDYFL